MLENMMCIIGRKKKRVNPYYYLPTIDLTTHKIQMGKTMQLLFKINGYQNEQWSIDVFNGHDIHTFFSTTHQILNRIKYLRRNDGLLIEDNKVYHFIDKHWIENVVGYRS